jgi:hypothetical protein
VPSQYVSLPAERSAPAVRALHGCSFSSLRAVRRTGVDARRHTASVRSREASPYIYIILSPGLSKETDLLSIPLLLSLPPPPPFLSLRGAGKEREREDRQEDGPRGRGPGKEETHKRRGAAVRKEPITCYYRPHRRDLSLVGMCSCVSSLPTAVACSFCYVPSPPLRARRR